MFAFLVGFSAASFLFFGVSCLVSKRMAREFERYGLALYRKVTGLLQIAAVVGFVLSPVEPFLGLIAAAGLALQMLLGVAVRIKIKDSLLQTTPALVYCLLNAYLCFRFWERIGS